MGAVLTELPCWLDTEPEGQVRRTTLPDCGPSLTDHVAGEGGPGYEDDESIEGARDRDYASPSRPCPAAFRIASSTPARSCCNWAASQRAVHGRSVSMIGWADRNRSKP
jgi:hypothetical protein